MMTEPAVGQSTQHRYEIVETVLRANITAGLLPPGLVLLEGPIADILQVSRAPVQRALQSLESDGLVHRFKGRGYLVGPPGWTGEPDRTDLRLIGLTIPEQADSALQARASWQRIYDRIERDVAGCVVFGQYRIIENELASHCNVSRTVVREVLTRLRERGLVRKNQSSHWIAGPLTAQTIKDHFGLRSTLEPPALMSGSGQIDQAALANLCQRLRHLEQPGVGAPPDDLAAVQEQFVNICILATANERLRDLICTNLLPVTATERLLADLGLPGDPATMTELRLITELLLRGATTAAAAMHQTHLDAAMNRTIAQMKIVAIIPGPSATAAYLTRVQE